MKLKNRFVTIKYILIVLLFTILFFMGSTKKVEANGIGYLREVGIPVSSSQISKINLNFKSPTHSSNLNSFFNASGVGDGNERALSLNTEYWLYAANAFTYDGTPLNLKITFKPTYINDRVTLIMLGGNTSNVQVKLYSYDAQVQVKYEITDSSGQLYNKNFCYGFTDPDGGDYLYSNAGNTQVYYKASSITDGNTAFGDAFRVENNGIIIQRDDIGFENSGLILVANHSNSSSFTINWSTKRDSNRPRLMDLLILPELYDEPTTLNIKINMNGGALQGEHSPNIGSNGNYVTLYSGDIAQSVLVTDLNQGIDIVNYNNPQFINVRRLGYGVTEGWEYNDNANGSGFTYDQGGAYYSLQEFGALNATGIIEKELFIKWVAQHYPIEYVLNGGTAGTGNPTDYTVDSNTITIVPPTRTGYNFAGWRKQISKMDWDERFLDYNSGQPVLNSSYPKAFSSGLFTLKAGVQYTISGYGSYNPNGIRWRIYDTSGNYLGGTTGGNAEGDTYTPTSDCLAKIMFINETTESQRNSIVITGNGNESPAVIPKGSAAKITLTAQWQEKTATLTYNANGHGTAPSSVTMRYTTATNAASAISATGYTFTGWNTVANGTGTAYAAGAQVKAANVVPTALTLYAQWTRNESTLLVDPGGGTVEIADLQMGTLTNIVSVNTLSSFSGVYGNKKAIAGVRKDETTQTNTFIIGYDERGGVISTLTDENTKSERIDTTTYSFDHWILEVTNGTWGKESLYNGAQVDSYTYGSLSNVTDKITAVFIGTTTTGTQGSIKLPSATKTGYTFNGWYTAASGGTKRGNAGANYTPTSSETLYAQWTPISYTIAYTLNSGTHGTSHPTSGTYDQVVNISNPTRTGYNFAGWTMTNGNTSTAMYGTSSTTVTTAWSNASTKVTAQYFKNLRSEAGTVTLVANWTEKTATLTYNANGHGTAPANVTMKYTTATNAASAITATGYNFTGWNTKADGSGTSYAAGAQVKAANVVPTATTLYAQWTEKTATLTYNANGHGTAPANVTMKYTTATNAASAITATGYNFTGWNTKADGSGTSYAAGAQVKAANVEPTATTLYAQWSAISYTIAYTLNSGTHGTSHPTSGTYDQVVNISNPTRTGYSFAGWTMTNGNTSTAMYGTSSGAVTTAWSNANTKVTAQYFKNLRSTSGTVTLVANWTANTYQMLYNGNGGTQLVNSNLVGKYDGYFNNGNAHSTNVTSWPDISGNNRNGTITNPVWGADYLEFDGTTWVNLGQMKSDYQTIEATFSIDALQSATQSIIGNWQSGGGGIYVTAAGKISGQYYINSAWQSINSSVTMEPNKVYHVALTYDGTTVRLYVNGEEVGTKSASGVIGAPGNSTVMGIGGNPSGSTCSPTFIGKMYNAAVYNTALTSTQIANDGGKVVTYGSTYGTLPDAARAGYTFKGWYSAPSGGTKITSSSTVSTIGDHMLYAQWTANTSIITIRKDNSNWTTSNNAQVALYQGGSSKYAFSTGTKSGATITWTAVTAGTYDIYASKDANNLTTLVDTGIDVTVTSTGTATIDYYTLTLNKGVGISAVSGAGTYLKNQAANIDATVATGYTWQGWSVVSGDSPN